MARLDGKLFYHNQQDGVSVMTPAHVMENIRKVASITKKLMKDERYTSHFEQALNRGLANIATTPIFSFPIPTPARVRPDPAPWFSASHDVYTDLFGYIEREGGRVEVAHDLRAPFAAMQMELHAWESPAKLQRALRFVTSEDDFEREFGITITEIGRGAR